MLDTSVVIAPRAAHIEGDLHISVVTVAELHFGLLTARTDSIRAERLRRLSLLEREFEPLQEPSGPARGH